MNTRLVDTGLLILRIGIGAAFIIHGAPKMFGGIEKWEQIGNAMTHLGIGFLPKFWGFMAALAEFGGGICLIFGLFFRVACLLLCFTMVVALIGHISADNNFRIYSHALEAGILFLGLSITGAGKYSLDFRLF